MESESLEECFRVFLCLCFKWLASRFIGRLFRVRLLGIDCLEILVSLFLLLKEFVEELLVGVG